MPNMYSRRLKAASFSHRRNNYEIEKLLQKYARVRIPKEEQDGRKGTQSSRSNAHQTINAGIQLIESGAKERTSQRMKRTDREHGVRSEGRTMGNDNTVDYGLAAAAADHIAQFLATKEPEKNDEREEIIRRSFLKNMAHDFHLKGRDEEPCLGRIRVTIHHKNEPVPAVKERRRSPPKAQAIIRTQPQPAEIRTIRSTAQVNRVQKVEKSVQSVTVRSRIIQMPTVKTTTVVRVRKV